nr:anti-sigma factor [Pontibacter vulgaris]
MEAYAAQYAVQPNPALKTRILETIAAQNDAQNLHEEQSTAETEFTTPVVPMYAGAEEKETSAYKWMFAASIVLFLVSGLLSYNFYNKWQQAESRLALALASEQQMAQNYNTASLKMEQQEQLLTIMRNPNYKPVHLQGVEAHPDANVMVYWNPTQQQVYLDILQLPAPPAGKQYQLWALDNGKPIDAGMLTMEEGKATLQQMKAIQSAQAFAITLEPTGGSINPTLEQLFVMGEIKS